MARCGLPGETTYNFGPLGTVSKLLNNDEPTPKAHKDYVLYE